MTLDTSMPASTSAQRVAQQTLSDAEIDKLLDAARKRDDTKPDMDERERCATRAAETEALRKRGELAVEPFNPEPEMLDDQYFRAATAKGVSPPFSALLTSAPSSMARHRTTSR